MRGLPPTSRTARAQRGIEDDPYGWGVTDYHLANVVDQLRLLLHAYTKIHFKKPIELTPTWRPTIPRDQPEIKASQDEIITLLESLSPQPADEG